MNANNSPKGREGGKEHYQLIPSRSWGKGPVAGQPTSLQADASPVLQGSPFPPSPLSSVPLLTWQSQEKRSPRRVGVRTERFPEQTHLWNKDMIWFLKHTLQIEIYFPLLEKPRWHSLELWYVHSTITDLKSEKIPREHWSYFWNKLSPDEKLIIEFRIR